MLHQNQTSRPLSDQERCDRLRLIRSKNVGPITFRRLLARCRTAEAALEALPELVRMGGGGKSTTVYSRAAALREIEAIAEHGARLIGLGEPDYPEPLAALPDAPPLITVQGHAHLLQGRDFAIVGARNASAAGKKFARRIAFELGQEGFVIVSGMARGIDTAAHEGALETGTIAVLAGGVDNIYPRENTSLHERIAEQGLLISEEPLGLVPQARHFPRRNRLVSGLSRGVLVVEAAMRSGSLITARLAGEQGREVFAVPGSPLDPRCRGTNELIRKGACLTEYTSDIIEALEEQLRSLVQEPFEAKISPATEREDDSGTGENHMVQARIRIREMLGPTAVTVDDLVRQSRLDPSMVATILLEMELAGTLTRHPGNQVSGA